MHTETFIDSNGNIKRLQLRFHREAYNRYKTQDLNALFADGYKQLISFIEHHRKFQVPRLKELKDYGSGLNHTVLETNRRKEEDMADHRAVHDFGGYIKTIVKGYVLGIPVRVEYVDEDDPEFAKKVNEAFQAIAKDNNFFKLDRGLADDIIGMGRSYDIVYRREDDKTKSRKLDPMQTFIIYDLTLSQHSVAGIRYYLKDPIGDSGDELIEVYTDDEVYYFGYKNGQITELDIEEHAFGQIEITETRYNEIGLAVYETVLNLIDLYDSAQSDTANYMTDLSDAILFVSGIIDLEDEKKQELVKDMRKLRFLLMQPPTDVQGKATGNVDAKYLYKQYDVAGTETYKTRLQKDIHKLTHAPDMNDERFSGNQTGEALKYKLFGLDQVITDIQTEMETSIRRRYELITTIGNLADEIPPIDPAKLTVTFTPNLPKSLKEQIENFVKLEGELSNETKMRVTNIVDDVQAEVETLEKEDVQQSQMSKLIAQNERRIDADLFGGE